MAIPPGIHRINSLFELTPFLDLQIQRPSHQKSPPKLDMNKEFAFAFMDDTGSFAIFGERKTCTQCQEWTISLKSPSFLPWFDGSRNWEISAYMSWRSCNEANIGVLGGQRLQNMAVRFAVRMAHNDANQHIT